MKGETFRNWLFAVLIAVALGWSSGAQGATITVPTDFPTIQAAIDDGGTNAGDTIMLNPGTFSEPAIRITKAIILMGSGTGSSFIETTSVGAAVFVDVDNVTIKDLTIQPGAGPGTQGIRFEQAGGTIDNTEVNNVHILDHSSNGMELHNATTVTNLRVIDSLFRGNGNGIRMASSSMVDGLTVTDSEFDSQRIGIYQANDGGTSTLKNLTVTGSTFTNHSDTAVFAEEVQDMLLDDNTFTGNRRGFTLFKAFSSAGADVENLTITNNKFNDDTQSSVLLFATSGGLMGDIIIRGNIINQDVGAMNANFGKIDIRLTKDFTHAPVIIDKNKVNFSGTFPGGVNATAAYAVKLRGNIDGILITGNHFDGGGVADGEGAPPFSGIFVESDGGFLAAAGTANINSCNKITNFVNGISIFDSANGVFGGLQAGAAVNVNGNNILGNSGLDIDNSGTSETINAQGNFWGGGAGNVSANVDASNPLSVSCAADHFLSYSLSGGDDDDSDSGSGSGGSSLKVDLMDQFGSGTFKVKEAVALYNPADKNGEGITDEKTHLVGYKITPSGGDDGSSDDDSGGGSSRFSVRIDNQFGALYLDTRNADRLLVPSLKDLENPIADEDVPATFSVDHFKCYRVARTSGKPRFQRRQVTVDDQFTNGAKKFDVRKPTRLCNPVEKKKGDEITPIQNPDLHLLCYEVKVAKGEPKHKKVKDLYVNNQFGLLQFDAKKEKELCVPSQKTVVGSPSDGDDDSS